MISSIMLRRHSLEVCLLFRAKEHSPSLKEPFDVMCTTTKNLSDAFRLSCTTLYHLYNIREMSIQTSLIIDENRGPSHLRKKLVMRSSHVLNCVPAYITRNMKTFTERA